MNPRSDLAPYIDRRRALSILTAGIGTMVIAACATDTTADGPSTTTNNVDTSATTTSDTVTSTSSATPSTTVVDCESIPEETAGPYPGDGSNGPDVLSIEGVNRRDIRSSIGGASGTAAGTELTIDLTIVDASASCAPLSGAAVYLWHADSVGRYSMYSNGVTDENYLRGVQVADGNGKLSFVSVFPGCYDGRWPHIHFEVYGSVDDVGSGRPLVTSQLAFPRESCEVAYTATGYENSVANLSGVSLESDMVFRDGVDQQVATVTGDVATGFTATLTVVV